MADATHPGTLLSGVTYNALGQPNQYIGGASLYGGVQTTFSYDTYGMGRMLTTSGPANGPAGAVTRLVRYIDTLRPCS